MESQVHQGFSAFRVSGHVDLQLKEDVVEYGNPTRKRRKHFKSKVGCTACRLKRIKCDEERPSCKQCTSKDRVCIFDRPPRRKNSLSVRETSETPARPNQSVLSTPGTSFVFFPQPRQVPSPEVSLPDMQLFHHFITCTAETMVFSDYFWNCKVVPLALQSSFIKHAVLAMAATHLHYLLPHDLTYRVLNLHHVSLALRGFRTALSSPVTAATVNGLISCAIILVHNSWGSADVRSKDVDNELCLHGDDLFPLAAGLDRLVWETKSLRDPAFFEAMAAHGPVTSIMQYAEQTELSSQLELSLACSYHSLRSSEPAAPEDDAAFTSAAEKLVPALVILKLHLHGYDMVGIRSDVARYLFAWPTKSEMALRKLIHSNYDAAQILFLYYYTAVIRLLPETCWWAQRRSRFFCRIILQQLRGKSNEYLQWATALREATERSQPRSWCELKQEFYLCPRAINGVQD